MSHLNDQQVADYFRRCYTAVDGLWFVKTEQKLGFDGALDVDDEVWKVMPKIQARALKALLGLQRGIDALFECFTTKHTIEGFTFKAEKDADGRGFAVSVSDCPWLQLLVKSNRQHLAEKVGTRICNSEYGTWAAEFGDDIRFELGEMICKGDKVCTLKFRCSS